MYTDVDYSIRNTALTRAPRRHVLELENAAYKWPWHKGSERRDLQDFVGINESQNNKSLLYSKQMAIYLLLSHFRRP